MLTACYYPPLMSAIQVKNVPEGLHEALRRRARNEGMTVSDYVLHVLQRDLSLPSQREWLEGLREDEPVHGADVVGALDEARREREEQLDAGTRRR